MQEDDDFGLLVINGVSIRIWNGSNCKKSRSFCVKMLVIIDVIRNSGTSLQGTQPKAKTASKGNDIKSREFQSMGKILPVLQNPLDQSLVFISESIIYIHRMMHRGPLGFVHHQSFSPCSSLSRNSPESADSEG